MTQPAYAIRPESPLDADAIERLHERAFGPGRYARTAYRLREGTDAPEAVHCFSALVGTLLVGSIRMAPVLAGPVPALMLGPVTVDPAFECIGIGGALIRTALDAARAAGERLVMLVGDEPYYRRFGFTVVPPGRLTLPGPANPARFLWIELQPGAAGAATGAVKPRRAF